MHLPPKFEERMRLLLQDEYDAFMKGYDLPLRRGLRINSAKIDIDNFFKVFPHPLEGAPFSEECFYLDSPHKAGSDPLHHAGAYYMQEPSASSAVSILDPQPGEWILDLCAAPGGKSTQIAARIGENGLLWSNEYVASRAKILQQNLERCGVRNAIISNRDTAPLCQHLEGMFDAVLVDAPCSGEGMFRKEPQALTEWSENNILLCATRQQEILNNAAKAVKPGGRLVYSTCTFAPEENECVVAAFLNAHPDFTLLPIDVKWGRPGFNAERVQPFATDLVTEENLSYCRRIFPQHGGEGHFIALLQRDGDFTASHYSSYTPPAKDPYREEAAALYADCFTDTPEGEFVTFGDQVRLLPCSMPDCKGFGSAGVAVASVCKNRLEPCHSIFIASRSEHCRRALHFNGHDPLLIAFLHGEEIPCDEKGWTAVCVNGCVVGFGKASGGKLKNRYPKGLRLL